MKESLRHTIDRTACRLIAASQILNMTDAWGMLMKQLTKGGILLPIFCQLSLAQRPEQVTAAEILARVTLVYASCRTYSDEGEVRAIFNNIPSGEQRFSTAFVRPASFRFEARNVIPGTPRSRDLRYVAWK